VSFSGLSAVLAANLDLTEVEIAMSALALDAGCAFGAGLACVPDAEPLAGADEPPDRAAPPSMATAQPDTSAAIVTITSPLNHGRPLMPAFEPAPASPFIGNPVWWLALARLLTGAGGLFPDGPARAEIVDQTPLLPCAHVAPAGNFVQRSQTPQAMSRRIEHAHVDAG
jgi:hypothetical protein